MKCPLPAPRLPLLPRRARPWLGICLSVAASQGVLEVAAASEQGTGQRVRTSIEEPAEEEQLEVRVEALRLRPFVGERVPVRILVTIDETFLTESMLQLFRRKLDVPIQLAAPWLSAELGEPEGLLTPGLAQGTIAIEERIVPARVRRGIEREGKRVTEVELLHHVKVSSPGKHSLAGVRVRFAYATRFREDFLQGRVASDRHDAFLDASPIELDVRPLPETGRPYAFTGAIGRFELEVSITPTRVAQGDSTRLELRVRGDGVRGKFEAPRIEFADFRVLGKLDRLEQETRVFSFDLSPQGKPGHVTLPAIEFHSFDPVSEAYVTAHSMPLEIEILSTAKAPPEYGPQAAETQSSEQESGSGTGFGVRALLASMVVAVSVLGFALARRRRRRRRRRQ